MKLPGVISLRKDLPIWPMPAGIFLRVERITFWKLTKMPCAVSGRRYSSLTLFSFTPWKVLNIRLNWRMPVKSFLPQTGHLISCSAIYCSSSALLQPSPVSSPWVKSSISLSARKRALQALQSISGSLKPPTWPEATHTSRFIRMPASRPTLYLLSWTNFCHQARLMLFLNSTPSGP